MVLDKKKVVVILSILLVLTVGYIFVGLYSGWKQQKNIEVFQQGAQYGFEQAIIQISQQAVTCQQVPLRIENETINMIAVDCLSQGA